MTLAQWVKNKILKFLGLQKLSENPNNERLTYISNDDAIRVDKIRCYKIWYTGEGDEILNYYTNQETYGWAANPIYNRNMRNFFWGLSAIECNIKRVHSGFPRAVVDSICSLVGHWKISCKDEALKLKIEDLIKKTGILEKTTDSGRKMTLVTGEVAYKVSISKQRANTPIVEVFDAEDIETYYDCDKLIAIVYKSYYKDSKGKKYILLETHKMIPEGSAITFELFRFGRNNELFTIPLDSLPETKNLPTTPIVLTGYDKVLGVVSKFYNHPIYKNKGWSLIAGCEDKFDELDEVWSQCSQTNRVSTPVEYYSPDILERTPTGKPIMPKRYDRQFVALEGTVDGDGINKNQGIITTQPELNYDKYMALQSHIEHSILIGKLSPASLGIDVSRKDNADAQREKEKVSFLTRKHIIDREEKIVKDLIILTLIMDEYMQTGKVTLFDYDFSVQYDEFANPTIETKLPILGNAWSQGQISTKQYTNLLWKDRLSEEELNEEIAYLESEKEKDNMNLGDMFGEEAINPGLPNQGPTKEAVSETEE